MHVSCRKTVVSRRNPVFSVFFLYTKLKDEGSLSRIALRLRNKYGEKYEMVSKKERKKDSTEI